ncbi:hypothetical protein ALQ61_03398 [Pseudomonas coronafaciens pv. zizaniae]|uniref:hypothetical protein n=1 Tax=Pseudomonas coronafaciens TaxID=53409 RepID=UPI000F00FF8A|nr:hypothetical protein [Pseudomonas coronafaciens]RMN29890.1 hypothetical protein ALQ61_03398 [Pseudomonas coronafaciens pv. zizaniae]
MPKSKNLHRANPGFESTIWIDHTHIIESASAFGDVAIALSQQLNPYDDPRLNVLFTNSALALELYFKSQLVERGFDPAFIEMTDDDAIVTTKEQYLNDSPGIVTILHSRLEVKKEFSSHELLKLYQHLNQDTQNRILSAVSDETAKIQTQDEMLEFLETINNFFEEKRYHFESFLTGIESDKKYIHTLIPVMKGVNSALANI